MQRSITSRNVLGGLIGGFLGIIAFAYFSHNALAMCVGCILGGLGGWHYDVMWSTICEEMQAILWRGEKKSWHVGLIELLSVVLYVGVHAGVVGVAYLLIGAGDTNTSWLFDPPLGWLRMSMVMFLLLSLVASFFVFLPTSADDYREATEFYKEHSFRASLFTRVWALISMEGMIVCLFALLLVHLVSCCFILAPFAVVMGTFKGLCFAASKRGHEMCIAVTLCVTAITAFVMMSFLTSQILVLAIALANGALCALAAEAFRRVAQVVVTHTRLEARLWVFRRRFWQPAVDLTERHSKFVFNVP